MLRKIIYFSVISISLLCNPHSFAQTADTTESEDSFKDDNDSTFKFVDEKFNFEEFEGKPAIDINYGFSKVSIDKVADKFAKTNSLEIRLGYKKEHDFIQNDKLERYNFDYFTFSNTSTDLASGNDNSSDLRSRMWQFGLGFERGYGYRIGSAAIIPYHAYGINWSRLEMQDFSQNDFDRQYIDLFDQSFRFGTMVEGGVKIKLMQNISINASYQREEISPRVLFWKESGSALIYFMGQGILDHFISNISESSPYAAPIVSFVLKNALSYGYYELKKEKTAWPFNSGAPLKYDTFKVGATFMF